MRVKLDQHDFLHRRVAQHFTHGEAVTTAQHQHALRRAMRGQRRVHQCFVITVFVARVELQVAVEEEAHATTCAATLCDDDALVVAALAQDDAVAVELVFGPGRQPPREGHRGQQGGHHGRGGQRMRTEPAQLAAKEHQCPYRHRGVEQAEEEARTHQAQVRHEDQWKGHRHHQRAEVVEGQHLRDEFAQRITLGEVALQNAHDERDFQPHEHAHQQHAAIQQHAERR